MYDRPGRIPVCGRSLVRAIPVVEVSAAGAIRNSWKNESLVKSDVQFCQYADH